MSTLIDYRRLVPLDSVGLCWASGPGDSSIDATRFIDRVHLIQCELQQSRVRSSLSLLLRLLTNPAIRDNIPKGI